MRAVLSSLLRTTGFARKALKGIVMTDPRAFFFREELLERTRAFISPYIAQGENPSRASIVYHGDGDGCGAAYFLARCLGGAHDLYWVSTPDFDFSRVEEHLMEKDWGMVIFLDMPVYNRPDMIERLRSKGPVLIYDHHYPGKYENASEDRGILYVNPIIHQGGQAYPSALFGWELLGERKPLDREVLFMSLYTETWLDKVGLFDDYTGDRLERLKHLARIIHSSFLVRGMSTKHYALDFLLKGSRDESLLHDSLAEVREYQVLRNIFELVQNEKSWVLRQILRDLKRIPHPAYVVKGIESQFRLCGVIASELRWEYPHLVVGIWQRWGRKKYTCELRRGNLCQMNLVSLIDRIKGDTEGIMGGGHPAAAAFTAEGNAFFLALRLLKELLGQQGGLSQCK